MRILSGIQLNRNDSQVFKWHSSSLSRQTILFFRAACLAFSVFGFFVFFAIRRGNSEADYSGGGGEWVALVLGAAFGLGGLFLLVETQTTIDPTQRKVWRESILLGRFVLFPRSFEFGDFRAALIRRVVDSEQCRDSFFMGLKRKNGCRLWLRYWNVPHESPCEQEEHLAKNIAKELGIPVER